MKTTNTFICSHCKKELPVQTNGGTGYGVNRETNEKICYSCIGIEDERNLSAAEIGEKFTLYRSGNEVTNWPGTFRSNIRALRTGHHNMAGKRYDFYFQVNSKVFHGVQYGDNTQIAHCKRIKG